MIKAWIGRVDATPAVSVFVQSVAVLLQMASMSPGVLSSMHFIVCSAVHSPVRSVVDPVHPAMHSIVHAVSSPVAPMCPAVMRSAVYSAVHSTVHSAMSAVHAAVVSVQPAVTVGDGRTRLFGSVVAEPRCQSAKPHGWLHVLSRGVGIIDGGAPLPHSWVEFRDVWV